jgi:hypothetical protein
MKGKKLAIGIQSFGHFHEEGCDLCGQNRKNL